MHTRKRAGSPGSQPKVPTALLLGPFALFASVAEAVSMLVLVDATVKQKCLPALVRKGPGGRSEQSDRHALAAVIIGKRCNTQAARYGGVLSDSKT